MTRIALITGGGGGIGRAAAVALARRGGYRLVLAGRRLAPLEATADLCRDSHIAPICLTVDVRDSGSVDALFATVAARLGRLDLLFNNAGVNAPVAAIDAVDDAGWREVIDTNLTGAFFCLRAAFRLMKAQTPSGGRIINNGSVAATSPRPHSSAYAASKHAITGLTKAAILDGRAHGILCGQIDIGNAASDMGAGHGQGALQPDGRIVAEPVMALSHVGEAIAYMDSLPAEANIPFMTLMAAKMPLYGRG